MTCDHLVGLYDGGPGSDGELLPLSQVIRTADFELANNARWIARGTGSPCAVARLKALDTREKALGARLESFGWCPRCGAKLESLAFLLVGLQASVPVDYG